MLIAGVGAMRRELLAGSTSRPNETTSMCRCMIERQE